MDTDKIDIEKLNEEAKLLGIAPSRISMTGFKSKKPVEIDKETAKQKKQAAKRLKNRIEKFKAEAKMKPIDKRLALLVSRFKAIRSRTRAHTYTDKNIEAWREEFNMIKNNPKAWNKVTENGTKPFAPGNKRKKTAKELLDEMDLD